MKRNKLILKNTLKYSSTGLLFKLVQVSKRTQKAALKQLSQHTYEIKDNCLTTQHLELMSVVPNLNFSVSVKQPEIVKKHITVCNKPIIDSLSSVKSLKMKCQVNETTSKVLKKLFNLVEFELENNEDDPFEFDFHLLPNLTAVHLVNSQVSLSTLESLSDSSLTTFTFSLIKNNQDAVSAISKIKSLKKLSLRANYLLAREVNSLKMLTNLTEIDIQNNLIGQGDYSCFPPSLTSLNVINNLIASFHCSNLAKLTNLTVLRIGWNEVGPEGALQIGKLVNLVELEINDNSLKDQGLRELIGLTKLEKINLANNFLNQGLAESLVKMPKLKCVTLNDNYPGMQDWEELTKLTFMKELNVSNCEVTDISLEKISKIVNLESLDVSSNYVSVFGFESIGRLINLTELNLSYNNVIKENLDKLPKSLIDVYVSNTLIEEEEVSNELRKILHF